MNSNNTQHQTDSVQPQSATASGSRSFDAETKIIVLLLALMLIPNIKHIFDPPHPQDIYQNVPNWYIPWVVLNEALPKVPLLAFLFVRRKSVLFTGVLILLPISMINIIVEIAVLKPIALMPVLIIRIVIIALYIILLRKSWQSYV